MIDLRKVRLPVVALHTKIGRGLTIGSLLALSLSGLGVGQALAAPSLDPNAHYAPLYLDGGAIYETLISTPQYPIGPWQTIRQTYECAGNTIASYTPYVSRSQPKVTANSDGTSNDNFPLLFTNWNFTDSTYSIDYYCRGNVLKPGTQPQPPQPPAPTPTPVPVPTSTPQSPQTPGYYVPYWQQSSSHW